jgi:hypothetical protein
MRVDPGRWLFRVGVRQRNRDDTLGACPRNTPEELLFFAGVLKQDDQIMFHGQELSSLLSG